MSGERIYRLPVQTVFASYLGSAPRYASMLLACYLAARGELEIRHVLPWVVGVVIAVGLTSPIISWLTTEVRVSPTTLRVKKGLLAASTIERRWEDCGSLEVETTAGQKLFGLATVKVGDHADSSANLTLQGVPADLVTAIRTAVDSGAGGPVGAALPGAAAEAQAGAGPSSTGAEDGVDSSRKGGGASAPGGATGGPTPSGAEGQWAPIVASYRWKDIAAATLCSYGIVVLLSGVLGGVFSLLGKIRDAGELAGRNVHIGPLAIAAAVVLSLAVTVAATGFAFYGMRVVRTDSSLELRHGKISERSKSVRWDKITGLETTANLLELLLGRCSVTILSADSGTGSHGKKMTLRSLPRHRAWELARLVAPEADVVLPGPESVKGLALRHAAAVALLAGVGLGLWGGLRWPLLAAIAGALAGALLALAGFAVVSARFSRTDAGIVYSRVGLNSRALHLPTHAPLGRTRVSLGQQRILMDVYHVYAGSAMRLPVVTVNKREDRA